MIVYNVTVKIDGTVHDEWLKWMKTTHIPDVMATGLFNENRMMRLIGMDETEGITYAIQYRCLSREVLKDYMGNHAPALQKEHTEKYKDKFVAFRTLMEEV